MLNDVMTLIKSVSGVRGIVFDNDSQGLSSLEIIHCINQFCLWIFIQLNNQNSSLYPKHIKSNDIIKISIGRDGRVSGRRISKIVIETIRNFGYDVINLDLTTTPSVQLSVLHENCVGGVMISASHNPIEWNGLKLLNFKGEFLSKEEGLDVFSLKTDDNILREKQSILKRIGDVISNIDYKEKHVESILALEAVDVQKIKSKKLKIVVDGINSSGGVYVPFLLKKMGVDVVELNCVPDGEFQHKPEPIPKNLEDLCSKVKETKADLGIAVDPDVDRLVLVCEDGSFFGEEYTIVSIAKYILSKYPNSSVVSNLSTTQALQDIAIEFGAKHFESPVGEVNVVQLMKATKSIIGGEGSGGVIFAPSHYGRDALVGIALFLTYLSESNLSVKELKLSLPFYFMLKERISISKKNTFNFDFYIKDQVEYCKTNNHKFSLIDGIKIYYNCGAWSHVRNSNTEPLIRLILEAHSKKRIMELKKQLICTINNYLK